MNNINVKNSEILLSIKNNTKPFNKQILEFLLEKNRITKETEFLVFKNNNFYSLKVFRIVKTEKNLFFYSKNEKSELIIYNPTSIYRIDNCSMEQILEIFSLNEDGSVRKDIKRKRGKKPELKNITKRNFI